ARSLPPSPCTAPWRCISGFPKRRWLWPRWREPPETLLWRAVGVYGIAAAILLVAVEEAIAIAIDADADTRAGRRARVGHLVSQHTGEGAEGGAADGWPGLPVAHEMLAVRLPEWKPAA